jgi:hypothetical protein
MVQLNGVTDMAPIQRPPPVRWERFNSACDRTGLPPRPVKDTIESGLAGVRFARMGKRGLLYVVAADFDDYACRLASTL